MNLNLTDKTALVTASSGGIGQAIAMSLAAEGAVVYINGRSKNTVEKAVLEIQKAHPDAKLHALVADAGTADGAAAIIEQLPEVDILVNNLGIYEPVGFFEETDESWQRLFEINIMSGVRLSRHYLAKMLEKNRGRIVFISSESGISPAPEMAHYSATKTMQISISRNLAELTKGTAVTVNTIMPGPTKTEGVVSFVEGVYPGVSFADAEKRFIAENRGTSLIMRFIEPKEIADLTAFVCSDLAGAINGAALRADGGVVRSVI